ncbi:transposase family protein [Streptomyces sp. NPDC047085]|uniref:helix-turn-helix domain-containing protein n=1 Tax=Streptomyces sp. NPDC047085 TaxID=3155140 RepID=UPI0033E4875D
MLDVPHEVVEYVSCLIYARRRELRSRWRRLSFFQQAVLVLVHLRKNETLQQVGVGFGVSTATAGRYVTEAVDVLADHAPTLLDALHHHDPNEFLILDGTNGVDQEALSPFQLRATADRRCVTDIW